jgi:hypothetical protein
MYSLGGEMVQSPIYKQGDRRTMGISLGGSERKKMGNKRKRWKVDQRLEPS